MNTQPLVSIALATFNGESHLAAQLDSLLTQDYRNLEIIISDDYSTDGTWKILQSYAARDLRIRLLPRKPNVGYVKNFLRAFIACRGDLISPSDQDDIWYPSKTRKLVAAIGDASLIYCNNRFIDDNNKPTGKKFSDVVTMLSGTDSRTLLFGSSICGHTMLFRRNLLTGNRVALRNAPYIDLVLAFLAMERNGVIYHDEVLVDWRHHPNSLSSYNWRSSKSSRAKSIDTDEKILAALSGIPGKHQDFMKSAYKDFITWRSSYVNLSMFLFVLKNGRITHRAHRAKFPALKYLIGQKLKRALFPNYY